MTIIVLFLLAFQQTFLFTPLTLMVLFLGANAQASFNMRRSIGLYSFGLPRRVVLFGPYFKGLLISSIGLLPLQLSRFQLESLHSQSFLSTILPTILLGGLVYLLPVVRQLRSREFLDQLKN